MKFSSRTASCSLLCIMLASIASAATQFSSHINVNTPARSYSHGVGDPVHLLERRAFQRQSQRIQARSLRRPLSQGYPRMKPIVPFTAEEAPRSNSLAALPWNYNSFVDTSIPVLPPSPYKVDSPDPESLWPEGLFLAPLPSPRFNSYGRRADTGEVTSDVEDPYLLEGSEAIAAVERAHLHGNLYFHDIPHIMSLLENQNLRIKNQLEPHRLASIRHTWPYYRT